MRIRRLLACAAALAGLWIPASGASGAETGARDQLKFGAEMARAGNWREAIYRWKKAVETDPDNPRLHNNLAVGYETLGQWDLAAEEYKKALVLGSSSREIRENYALFQNFYDQVKRRLAETADADAADKDGPAHDEPAASEPSGSDAPPPSGGATP